MCTCNTFPDAADRGELRTTLLKTAILPARVAHEKENNEKVWGCSSVVDSLLSVCRAVAQFPV